jgi:hypothetical protein
MVLQMLRRLLVWAPLVVLLAQPRPSLAASHGRCHIPSGASVVFRTAAGWVISRPTSTDPNTDTTLLSYDGCLQAVGRRVRIDTGNYGGNSSGTSSSSMPGEFVLTGDYLSFVQVGTSAVDSGNEYEIEQWNLRSARRTLDPRTVPGAIFGNMTSPPRLVASRRGFLAWVSSHELPAGPMSFGVATDLNVFDGRTAAAVDTFNSETDAAPPGTSPGTSLFSHVAITGTTLRWRRYGVPRTARIT